jgi:two-component system, NtrC family, sensor kinase
MSGLYMPVHTLKRHFLLPFLGIFILSGIIVALFCFVLIYYQGIERAQQQVAQKLTTARIFYESELDSIESRLSIISPEKDSFAIRSELGLDYCRMLSSDDSDAVASRLVKQAFAGKVMSGTRIMPEREWESYDLSGQTFSIPVLQTPKASPTQKKALTDIMVLEAAVPVYDDSGSVTHVLYGGRVLNKNYTFVDRIHTLAFEDTTYKGRPYGTVTIFQDDVRIATNVLTKEGERAIGTRVSAEVYDKVVRNGSLWIDRAFVVNDWYLTAYQPIRAVDGSIIGILYVGILEKPFIELGIKFFSALMILFFVTGCGVVIVTYALSGIILKPVDTMLEAIDTIRSGDLGCQIESNTPVRELNYLAASFNEMSAGLKERQSSLEAANETLAMLNRNYMDLIGFVAHELKGVIASTIMSAYTVRDGYLGPILDPQKKSLDMVIRNLDYLTSTIRSFLNLSTIEKGELSIDPGIFRLKEDVIDMTVSIFKATADSKGIRVQNMLRPELKVDADRDLIQIVSNNLIGNAIKYGQKDGQVFIRARHISDQGTLEVEIYNDGEPLTPHDQEKLFKKFSRVIKDPSKKIKGTGLGLYISKEIIERHGTRLWHEARANGNVFKFELPIAEVH